ncbi:phage tail assembly protein [Paracoccus sp. (in: a-proteobacteria)]|uniref:phage tail assembly protein n=1 Tax=Paracoccus sp. TaxID=267 RepID=UPI002AFE9DBD|nr:phage tail assembly protein [Paracoccus sp. (in: a-proteobacteria)]
MEPLKLSKSYTIGSETFDTVEFREPNYADYRQIGAPMDFQKGILVRDREATFAYVDRLVTRPAAGALQTLTVTDAMALEDHILRFFITARTSRAQPTSSSSVSDGTPDTSMH